MKTDTHRLHADLMKAIMLEVQFGDFGAWQTHPEHGTVYVTSGKQAVDLEQKCHNAATSVIDVLINKGLLKS